MFSSNQVKQEEYLKLRAQEEDNNRKHQRRLYKKLAQEQGEETTGTNLARLAERVAGKFGDKGGPPVNGKELSLSFGTILKRILTLKPNELSEKAQGFLKGINTPEWKKNFNDYMAEFLTNTKQSQPDLTPALTKELADEEAKRVIFGKNQDVLNELVDKVINTREIAQMGSEDREIPVSVPATPAETQAQRDAQANLDLIALFQQDVKEGRKRQALKDLAQLNADEDYRLRSNFMNVLEHMMDEVNSRSAKEKAKAQYKIDKAILDKLMNSIENQRMHDSFLEYSAASSNDAFATKLQRNLKALMFNKRIAAENKAKKANANIIENITPYNDAMQRRNELMKRTRNKAASTIKKLFTTRANRLETTSTLPTASLTTNAEPRPDLRQFNGRPSEPLESKFNRLTDILNIPVSRRSKKQKKTLSNLRGTTHNVKPIIELMEHL